MKKDVLYVRMFGHFEMEWNEKNLLNGAKSRESQFALLMQMILHYRKEGVSKDQLKQAVFEERELENDNHALRSVMYNARRKLLQEGLPDLVYFVRKGDRYFWNEEIPVWEDACEMERLQEEARKAVRAEQKLAAYVDACHLYRGEFLETQSGTIWVAKESRRYHSMFCSCMENAVELLRADKDFMQMEELGILASKVDPLADWESVTMEALVSSGRHMEARKLYNDTQEMYFSEQGLRPSHRLYELMQNLGAQIEHDYAVLDDIQKHLSMEDEDKNGGYLCTYPVFQGIYQMVLRMMRRNGQSVYLMLCTVTDYKGNPMKDGAKLDELSQRLGDAICHSVRRSDAINRYGKGQYLVLLVNTTRENCSVVQRRINHNFIVGRQRTGVQYHVNSVICTLDQERVIMGKGEN